MHLASYVPAPIEDRGGLMILAPPGHLKTTALMTLDRCYHNVVAHSNLNTKTLSGLRSDLVAGAVRSLVLPDLQSLYAGDPRTVERLEQMIMQLTCEGHLGTSMEDTRFRKFITRATVFGAMPFDFAEKHMRHWRENGFARRFVWSSFQLQRPEVLEEALIHWQRATIKGGLAALPQLPIEAEIPAKASQAEMREISTMLKDQPGPHHLQLVFLGRTLSALKHHYERTGTRKPAQAIETLREFGRSLGQFSVDLVLD